MSQPTFLGINFWYRYAGMHRFIATKKLSNVIEAEERVPVGRSAQFIRVHASERMMDATARRPAFLRAWSTAHPAVAACDRTS